MKIRMLETHRGSDDGFTVRRYHKDILYAVGNSIGDSLARCFIAQGYAVEERAAA